MIGQFVLTIPLLAVVVYAYVHSRQSPMVAAGIAILAASNVVFTWLPDLAASASGTLNVGSAGDLIAYVWIGILLLVALNLHLRDRRQMEVITALARHVAMRGVSAGETRMVANPRRRPAVRRDSRSAIRGTSVLRGRSVASPPPSAGHGERETGAPRGTRP